MHLQLSLQGLQMLGLGSGLELLLGLSLGLVLGLGLALTLTLILAVANLVSSEPGYGGPESCKQRIYVIAPEKNAQAAWLSIC